MDAERQALAAASHALQEALGHFRTRREWLASPQGAVLGKHLAAHLDRVRTWDPESAAAAPPARDWVHVVHWNILHGKNYDAVRAALRDEPALAGADLLSLNEVDLGLARSGNRDVAFDLARELGLHAAWTPLFLELEAGYRTPPAVAAQAQGESLFGMGLLSRWPLGSVRRLVLHTPADLLFDRERKAGTFVALLAAVERPGAPFHCVVTHLDVHGSPPTRLAQVQQILAAVPPGPALLAGDLNTTTFGRGGGLRALRTLSYMALAPRGTLRRRLLAPHQPAGAAREPLFDALREASFRVEPFNDGSETLDLHFDDLHELDFLPAPLRHAAVALLHGVERRNGLRLDWIAGRGFAPAAGMAPRALPALLRVSHPASDHAPITCGLQTLPA